MSGKQFIVSIIVVALLMTFRMSNAYAQTDPPKKKNTPRDVLLEQIALMKEKVYMDMAEALKEPAKVKVLFLTYRDYTEFPSEVFRFPNLEYLSLEGNHIQFLPDSFSNIKTLKFLDLSYNQRIWGRQVIREVSDMEGLTTLALAGNRIYKIPPEIGKLTNLKVLGLEENLITELPTQIKRLRSLEVFYLGNNKIDEIPKEIGKMRSLQHFDISNNKLSEIPIQIGELYQLKKLVLRHNDLSEIPYEVLKLKKLEILDLRYNPRLRNQKHVITSILPESRVKMYP